jgi:hypothetical protein
MSYEERRVRVKVYGTTASSSGLLVPIASVGKARRLHTLAAAAFVGMAEAVKRDLGLALKVASGWRAHRWQSRQQYESVLVKRFGSVAEGRKWLAYNSPHETGLAIDIGVGGLWPSRSTASKQKQQPLHKWLVANAHEFGWHPYKVEPWHWEFPMSLQAFASGVVGPDDPGPPVQNESFGPEGAADDEWALEDEDLGEMPGEEVEAPPDESALFPGEAPRDEPYE